jgi:hypothetical protein
MEKPFTNTAEGNDHDLFLESYETHNTLCGRNANIEVFNRKAEGAQSGHRIF